MEKAKSPEKPLVDRVWDFFASVKLAIVTFGLIALTSIIGTVIEQGGEPEKNLEVLRKLFGEALAPTLYRISEALGFMDMYHSWWFISFLVIFITNLVICSLDRLPRIIRLVNEPLNPLPIERFRAYPIKSEIKVESSTDGVRNSVRHLLGKMGFKALEVSESGNTQFYAQKGAYSRYGVYVTHLSIIVIMLGAVIGIFFGFNGFLNLPEGYYSDVAYERNTNRAHPLGFTIKCDDFDVEFYEGKDMPKDYRSWLTITKNGKVVKKQMIEVNVPLKYEGYTFYQSSYGPSAALLQNPHGIIILRVTSTTGQTRTVNLEMNGTFEIPGTGIVGKVTDYSPAIAFRNDGSTFTYSQMMNNPAVYVTFSRDGKELYSGWLLKRYPRTWNLPDGNRVEFIDYWGMQYTGLQVRKDPGVWIVYLGCLVMAVGLYMAFFMSHRKIWVAVTPDGRKATRVLVAATANKNRPSFQKDIEQLISSIHKEIQGGTHG